MSKPTVSIFRVDHLNLLKLAGGGVGFIFITLMLMARRRHDEVDFLVEALMAITALVLLVLFYTRFNERIEIDSDGIRCVRPLRPFAVRWSELDNAWARKDSLGPFVIHFVMRNGPVHKLNRIYQDWEELIDEVVGRAKLG